FGDVALERLPLPDLLHHAFVSLPLGRWLDERLDAPTRRAHLAWVREAHVKATTRAAAYEVALLLSLADAHVLYRLAEQVTRHRREHPTQPGRALDGRYRAYSLPKRSGGT